MDEHADGGANEPRGQIVGSYTGTIVLRDPNPGDVSRAGRPLVPDPPEVLELEATLVNAATKLGYAVTVRLTRTDA